MGNKTGGNKPKAANAQAGAETIILLSIGLVVLIGLIALSVNFLTDLGRQSKINEARKTVDTLAQAADFVYAQGEGANQTVLVDLPNAPLNYSPGLSDYCYPSESFIGRPPLKSRGAVDSANMISLSLDGTDVSANTIAPVTGTFPCSGGKQLMNVVSRGNFVSVGNYPVDVSPRSISIVIGKHSSMNVTLNFTLSPSEMPVYTASVAFARVAIIPYWSYGDVRFDLNQSIIFMNATNNQSSATMEFTASSAAGGIYNSQAYVYVYQNYTGNRLIESFPMPITVEIR